MILAVDTGGTKTLIVEFNSDGAPVKSTKYPTPTSQSDYIDTLFRQVTDNFNIDDIDAISIATPGFIEDGTIKHYGRLGWQNFQIINDLQPKFPNKKIFLENDSKLGALGVAPEAPQSKRLMYLTLSTGIGMGMIIDGNLSKDLIHAEAGKITLYKNELPDIWENIASGKSFYEKHGSLGSEIDDPLIWKSYASDVNLGLSAIVAVLQPDTIIFGGSMGKHFHKYREHLESLIKQDIWNSYNDIKIMPAKHPEEAVAYGCYAHAKNLLANK